MYRPGEVYVKVNNPSNLNVATRSTVPSEVERGDTLIESREPMIISLVLDVLICISLLAIEITSVCLSFANLHRP